MFSISSTKIIEKPIRVISVENPNKYRALNPK